MVRKSIAGMFNNNGGSDLNIAYKNNLLQPLKGFCTIVECNCSFKEASEKLFLTPATLTKQVQSLEKELSLNLFDRSSLRKLKLTETGKKFYADAIDIVSRMDSFIYNFKKKINKEEETTLRVGITSFMFNKMLLNMDRYKEKKPELTLNLCSFPMLDGFNALLNDEIDVFMSPNEDKKADSGLEFIKLTDYIPYWVLWKGHRLENKRELTKEDLLKEHFMFSKDEMTMPSLKAFINDNKIESVVDIGEFGVDCSKFAIRNKICIWIIFNVFMSEEDKKYFVFKDARNLFPGGEYGCYIKKHHKNIINNFIEFLKTDECGIVNLKFSDNN